MSVFSRYKAELEVWLDKPPGTNPFIDVLITIENKTRIPRVLMVLGVIAVCLLAFIVGYGAKFLANFIGFLYPAYASFKAIQSPDKDDDTKWLTYWVTYGCFAVVFEVSDIVISWLPFYHLLKCCFFLWLMNPGESNGALILYQRLIYPIYHRHESDIDAAWTKITDTASNSAQVMGELGADIKSEATKIASDMTADALAQAMTEEEDNKTK